MPARYFMAAAHEQFSPRGLLDQADAAERAGFDGVCCSDHFQPWWEPGESGQAWAWLGGAGGARMWKSTLVHDYFFDDWHDPSAMEWRAQNEISDEEMLSSFIVAADPDEHVARIRDIEDLGATTVVLMNVSGADSVGAVETHGRHVLPALRGRLHWDGHEPVYPHDVRAHTALPSRPPATGRRIP